MAGDSRITRHPMVIFQGMGRSRNAVEALAKDAGIRLRFETECP